MMVARSGPFKMLGTHSAPTDPTPSCFYQHLCGTAVSRLMLLWAYSS